MQLFQNISYLDLCEGEMGRLGQVAVGGAGLLTVVGVARWKAWPAVEKCLLKLSTIVDLFVATVFPCLSAVGSWEEVSHDFLEFVLQDANFCLKKLAFAFLTACVYWFLTSLKSCISWGYSMLMPYATG